MLVNRSRNLFRVCSWSLPYSLRTMRSSSTLVDCANNSVRFSLEAKDYEKVPLQLYDMQLQDIPVLDGILPKYFVSGRSLEDVRDLVSQFEDIKQSGYIAERADYQALIKACCKWKEYLIALSLITEMKNEGISMNKPIRESFILSLCSAGRIQDALDEVITMKDISSHCFHIIFDFLQKGAQLELAQQLDAHLLETGWERTQQTYEALFSIFLNNQRYEEYQELYQEYITAMHDPKPQIFNGLLRTHLELKEFAEFFDALKRIDELPIFNAQTYAYIGEASAKTNQFDYVLTVLLKLIEKNDSYKITNQDKQECATSIINSIATMTLDDNQLFTLFSQLENAQFVDNIYPKIIAQTSDDSIEKLFWTLPETFGNQRAKILAAVASQERYSLFNKFTEKQLELSSGSPDALVCMIETSLQRKELQRVLELLHYFSKNCWSPIELSLMCEKYILRCHEEQQIEKAVNVLDLERFPPISQRLLDIISSKFSTTSAHRTRLIDFLRLTKRGGLESLNIACVITNLLSHSIEDTEIFLEVLSGGNTRPLNIIEAVSVLSFCSSTKIDGDVKSVLKLIQEMTKIEVESLQKFKPESGQVTESQFLDVATFLCQKDLFVDANDFCMSYLVHYRCYDKFFKVLCDIDESTKSNFSLYFFNSLLPLDIGRAFDLFLMLPKQNRVLGEDLQKLLVFQLYSKTPRDVSPIIAGIIRKNFHLNASLFYQLSIQPTIPTKSIQQLMAAQNITPTPHMKKSFDKINHL